MPAYGADSASSSSSSSGGAYIALRLDGNSNNGPPLSPSSSTGTTYRSSTTTHTRPRRLLYVLAGVVLLFLAVTFSGGSATTATEKTSTTTTTTKLDFKKWTADTADGLGLSRVFSPSSNKQKNNQYRITLVVLWDDDHLATYLPSFFTSAAANSDAVDILWINVKRSKPNCLDVTPYIPQGNTNIKTICISDEEDKLFLRKYLCHSDNWNCSIKQVDQVDNHLKNRRDPIHVQFKPLRGGVYKDWIKTDWWAWADADQLIGNFKDLFPWETLPHFHLITISEWDHANIYLRGQFTAFSTSDARISKLWTLYPPLSSPDSLPTLGTGALDEFEYSTFYLNTLAKTEDGRRMNWLLIPRALGADKFGRNKPVYGGGAKGNRAFYVPEEMRRRDVTMLLDERWIPKPERSFAAVNPFEPEKWAVPARELRHGDYVYDKPLWQWCDQKETRCTVLRDSFWHSSTLMRYKGELLEYFDQRSKPRAQRIEAYYGTEEKLFIHMQENKRFSWFAMPKDGVGEDEIMEIRDLSIVKWNKHTMKDTFVAQRPNAVQPQTLKNELLSQGYWGVNGSNEMPLPVGIKNILLDP